MVKSMYYKLKYTYLKLSTLNSVNLGKPQLLNGNPNPSYIEIYRRINDQ